KDVLPFAKAILDVVSGALLIQTNSFIFTFFRFANVRIIESFLTDEPPFEGFQKQFLPLHFHYLMWG
ncbi:MAG: hypothetical protein RL092_423, partial [Bacteroidota bacterium]